MVSRFGELRGIRGIKPRAQVELLPYAVGQTERFAAQPGNPFETGTDRSGMVGLDAKVGITNDVTLNSTVNPDFGQVEADPSVVNLTAFETFYPEKRPFFVEGANVFAMPITSFGTSAGDTLFYSRRIGRPPQYQPRSGSGAYRRSARPDVDPRCDEGHRQGRRRMTFGLLDAVTAEEQAAIDTSGSRSASEWSNP